MEELVCNMAVARNMQGRKTIYTSVEKVTAENVRDVLSKAMATHQSNESEINYLYQYYKGNQPIRYRQKATRPDINNKIVENRANEIVSFKVGYLCGEPIQYVSRDGNSENVVKAINTLNEFMFAEDKAAQDQQLVEWQMICGTSFRMVLPDAAGEEDESPFELYTLDPRNTFVVYSSKIGNRPMMGVVYYVNEEDRKTHYTVYTDNECYYIHDDEIAKVEGHTLGVIPIFEYPANNAKLGSFEIVLPLLDSLNTIDSNRLDGVEQFVQAFIKFINCEIDADEYEKFLQKGAIMVKSVEGQHSDVDMVTSELNQTQAQTLKQDVYNSVLTICGMPNRNGGSSTSDTGSAVLLRDGWSDAEARAKDSENVFKRSEKKMLALVLRICKDLREVDLHLRDIEMRFTRRNYDNIQSKSQVLISMLGCEKIHPLLAFQHAGMFPDSEAAYSMSMKYYKENHSESTQNPLDGTGETNPELR